MEHSQPEEITPISENKKRPRDDDSDSCFVESKLARADSDNSELIPCKEDSDSVEPGFDSENSDINSPGAKRIQDELLSVLDDFDEPPVQGLDSVIKSFEEEILQSSEMMTSFSGEAQPDLGYLLEASDDELGLPPTFSSENKSDVKDNAGSVGEFYGGFENELGVGYDSFELGLAGEGNKSYNEGEGFVTLGGLFDYSDESFGSADVSGFQWQAESLSAL